MISKVFPMGAPAKNSPFASFLDLRQFRKITKEIIPSKKSMCTQLLDSLRYGPWTSVKSVFIYNGE